jgi:hypothetical protein
MLLPETECNRPIRCSGVALDLDLAMLLSVSEREAGYSDLDLLWFSSFSAGKFGDKSPFKSLPVHHSS